MSVHFIVLTTSLENIPGGESNANLGRLLYSNHASEGNFRYSERFPEGRLASRPEGNLGDPVQDADMSMSVVQGLQSDQVSAQSKIMLR